jgi:antitoxin (DNA-binding transcriptional repressor) of toxin-antitoxin stability system
MKAISIRDLHLETGRWIRRAGQANRGIVTDRGRPVAALVPLDAASTRKLLPDREAEIRRLQRLTVDSAAYVSEGRNPGVLDFDAAYVASAT